MPKHIYNNKYLVFESGKIYNTEKDMRHAIKNKLLIINNKGENNGQSKLSLEQVKSIIKDDRKQKDIARYYGICQQTVSDIKKGKR